MKKLILASVLALPGLALAAPMYNEDVIKMVKGGLSEATVHQAINAAEPAFDTSPDGLVRLKQGGVSDNVIQHIMSRESRAPVLAAPPPPPPMCGNCGTVLSFREVDKPGHGGATGAVAGAVVGGLLGNAIGGHSHRTAGTDVGAAGGAVAGYEIQKHASAGKTWEIAVRMVDGSTQTVRMDQSPWRSGDRVRLVNGALTPL